ncbi:MAG: chorismate-binding protein, partial [Planctomycetota bacterium]
KIKHYIIEGDTYQINFSQRLEMPFTARPVDVFHWQNRFNPSPFAAYLAWDDRAVVSASPELFLKVRDNSIVTRPIKGTRPRNPLLPDDAATAAESVAAR